MQFDVEHGLLTVHGTLGNPISEDWSFGLRGTFLTPPSIAELQGICDASADPCAALVAGVCNTPTRLTHVKLAPIGLNGLYPPGRNAAEYVYVPPVAMGGTATMVPFQQALAVSLGTTATRGIATKGRFFLPRPKLQVDPDGRHPADGILAIANLAKTWLNALHGIGFLPAIMSQGTQAHPAPEHNSVTTVRVGRVPDTIRSRRRNLVEDYQQVTL
jgi:hypothetical protein